MQWNINSLIGNSVDAADGDIGEVEDFYFDDKEWTVRYLVLKTGHWLHSRKMLISTYALVKHVGGPGLFQATLTKAQLLNSPDIDTDQPVYRQQEIELHGYYAWQNYWDGGFYAGGLSALEEPFSTPGHKWVNEPDKIGKQSEYDQHLRSTNKIIGYTIHTADGEIGQVADYIICNETWEIVYLVVDTHLWFGGKQVLVPVKDITEVQWADSTVYVNITVEAVKDSVVFDKTRVTDPENGHPPVVSQTIYPV